MQGNFLLFLHQLEPVGQALGLGLLLELLAARLFQGGHGAGHDAALFERARLVGTDLAFEHGFVFM